MILEILGAKLRLERFTYARFWSFSVDAYAIVPLFRLGFADSESRSTRPSLGRI